VAVPKYYELFNPLLSALSDLGGSGSISELEEKVAENMRLPDEDVNQIHKGNRTKFSYNLAWARTYLKRYGLLDNSSRGVWSLSQAGLQSTIVAPEEVIKRVQMEDRAAREAAIDDDDDDDEREEIKPVSEIRWQDVALDVLKKMSPDAFERLCQRILRESGFIQVEVTGRTGDGGIDGKGVVKL
jgi:restriction system protein